MSNASDILTPNNPANAEVEPKRNRANRVPMSVPSRKLETPEIPGYHSHWIKESNVPRALQAWYEFVSYDEVPVNQRGFATSMDVTGNTDLGSQVSISAGIGADGRPERLILMKLAEDLWLADRKAIDERNASIVGSIFRGEKIIDKDQVSADVSETRYVKREETSFRPALFQRRRKKSV